MDAAEVTRYLFMGADPGFTGATGFLVPVEGAWLAEVSDMPIRIKKGPKRIDVDTLAARVVRHCQVYKVERLVAAVEAVGARAKEDRKEGTSSMFRFGQGQGEVRGVLSGIGACSVVSVQVFEVPGSVWKVKAGMSNMSKDEVTARAERDFPECAGELRGPRGGAKHGRAEALYLARYAKFLVTGKGL